MRFSKTNNIYKIIKITGSQDNILGISFGEDNIEVIEWNFNKIDKSRIRTSKEEVLEQVLSGLESILDFISGRAYFYTNIFYWYTNFKKFVLLRFER